jgi:hypothetical protein
MSTRNPVFQAVPIVEFDGNASAESVGPVPWVVRYCHPTQGPCSEYFRFRAAAVQRRDELIRFSEGEMFELFQSARDGTVLLRSFAGVWYRVDGENCKAGEPTNSRGETIRVPAASVTSLELDWASVFGPSVVVWKLVDVLESGTPTKVADSSTVKGTLP